MQIQSRTNFKLALLPILTVPHPALRQRARRVKQIDHSINMLLDNMVETMRNAHGIGLAANQVGSFWRVITIEIPPPEDNEDADAILYRLVNPSIVKRSGNREVEEGCLSIPGYRGFIERSLRVTVKAMTPDSKEIRIKADELLAQALEHEIDHLNGILYTDHLASHEKLEKIEPADPQSTTS